MKNFSTIIKSELSINEQSAAELLRELSGLTNHKNIKLSIMELRIDLFKYNLSENDLKVACEFHNILDVYSQTY